MKKIYLILVLTLIAIGYAFAQQKNVVFIICDDLNDNIHGFGGHPQAYTPNIDRLAKIGVRFSNAQSNAPMCGPSRPSLLSGYYPSTTGMYSANPKFRTLPKLKEAVLFPTYMKMNGYQAYHAGKVFHSSDLDLTVFGASSPTTFDGGYVGPKSNYSPYPWDGEKMSSGIPSRNCENPNLPETWQEYNKKQTWGKGHGRLSELPEGMQWVYADKGFEGADGKSGGIFKYNGADDRSLMPDEIIANWAVNLLTEKPASDYLAGDAIPLPKDKPFVMAVGFIKTHYARYVPDEFYDEVLKANKMQSEDDIIFPWSKNGQIQFDDLKDVSPTLLNCSGRRRYDEMQTSAIENGGTMEKLLKAHTMSYLASVYEIDVQVGKVLDALEESGKMDNTIIIFTSDHGYHNGDKECSFKYTLWEKAARVPFILYDPSSEFDATRGKECTHPISLIDIYPTLNDLCQLPHKGDLDGYSIKPFLQDVDNKWEGPDVALVSVMGNSKERNNPDSQNFAVRSEKYRYILTKEGEEELYNHEEDPYEWTNLAYNSNYKEIKVSLHNSLCQLSGRSNLYNSTQVSHKSDEQLDPLQSEMDDVYMKRAAFFADQVTKEFNLNKRENKILFEAKYGYLREFRAAGQKGLSGSEKKIERNISAQHQKELISTVFSNKKEYEKYRKFYTRIKPKMESIKKNSK